MLINTNKLKGKVVENGMTISDLAAEIGVDKSTLYRKLDSGGETMLIKDACKIADVLKLSEEEVMSIFFSQFVA